MLNPKDARLRMLDVRQ